MKSQVVRGAATAACVVMYGFAVVAGFALTFLGTASSAVAAESTEARDEASRGPRGMPGPGPFMDIDRLAILLDMDDYQKTEVGKLLTAQRAAMRAELQQARESGDRPSREERAATRAAAEAALLSSLEQILTEPQITKFKVLLERPAPPSRRERKAE